MNALKPTGAALGAVLACALIAACDRDTTTAARKDAASVGQKVDTALAQTKEDLARAGDRIKPTLERAGEQIKEAGREVKPTLEKAGEKIKEAAGSDAAITTSIKADYLKDPDLSVFKIDVDTKDGVVTLNGMADNAAARDRAARLAQSIKGVKEVRNHLTVKQG